MICDRCLGQRCLLCDPTVLDQVDVTASESELASLQKDLRERGTAVARITPDRTLTWIPVDKLMIFTRPEAAQVMGCEAVRLRDTKENQ